MRLLPALAVSALLLGCGPKPPEGMKRLDSGDLNWGHAVGQRFKNLYYADGDGFSASHLYVVDLETGKRKEYRFPERRIKHILPAPLENAVMVGAEDTQTRSLKDHVYMEVDPDTGKVLVEEPRETVSRRDLFVAGRTFGGSDPFAVAPSSAAPVTGGGGAAMVEIVEKGAPGVRAALDAEGKRVLRFYPTPSIPDHIEIGEGGKFYATYVDTASASVVEEFDYFNGTRRLVARFEGSGIESLAVSGVGILVIRQDRRGSGPRLLSLLDSRKGRVLQDLPWSDGESRILAVDPGRGKLYVTMYEGDSNSCWAVPLAEKALVAASDYLARARGPKVRRFHVGAGRDILVMALMACAAVGVIIMARSS
ncbi:MAG: hypothetical protein HY924_08230 [Elusimicrobia bacterium]|nr:hypothetical protein [Elusimicrobiota bacterium]